MTSRRRGLSMVTLLALGAILTTSALSLAVDFTRQFNVARQTEATYQDQYAIQGGVQHGMAYVIRQLDQGLNVERNPPGGHQFIAGRELEITITTDADGNYSVEAAIVKPSGP